MPKVRAQGEREVLIEIVTLGTFAKVTAIDCSTGTEVSITGPANAQRASLERAAVRKLEFVLNKKGAGPG